MGYLTVADFAEASFIEKRSEFIGYISPATTNDEAVEFISSIREKHRKATHNVYAYILREGNISRYSDDGEPQGTAGVPVLNVLKKNSLTDVCCVVTRYFGGILLGGGGLVRAYSHAAGIAVEKAQVLNMCECFRISLKVDYTLYGKISYAFPEFDVRVLNTEFGSDVEIALLVRTELYDKLSKKLTDLSGGKIIMAKSDIMYEDFA